MVNALFIFLTAFASCPLSQSWDLRAYLLLGTCDATPAAECHAGLWIESTCSVNVGGVESEYTEHRLIFAKFAHREPRLREYAEAQNTASWWLLAWRAVHST